MKQIVKSYWMYVVFAALVIIFWDSWFVKPFKFFAVMIHEYSHAMAGIITGGSIVEIRTFGNESGHTLVSGGFMPLVASAGYVGSALIGALFLYSVGWLNLQRFLLFVLGAASIVLTFLHSPFGELDYWIGIGGGILLIASVFSNTAATITANWIGVVLLLYSLHDFRTDLWQFPEQTDAGILARYWNMSFLTYPIAFTWVFFSIFVMYKALKAAMKRATSNIETHLDHTYQASTYK